MPHQFIVCMPYIFPNAAGVSDNSQVKHCHGVSMKRTPYWKGTVTWRVTISAGYDTK